MSEERIAIIEAAFELEAPQGIWLAGLLETLQQSVEDSPGIVGILAQGEGESSASPVLIDCRGMEEESAQQWRRVGRSLFETYWSAQCVTLSQLARLRGYPDLSQEPIWVELLQGQAQARDLICLGQRGADGQRLWLLVLSATEHDLSEQQAQYWEQLREPLGLGMRLRAQMASSGQSTGSLQQLRQLACGAERDQPAPLLQDTGALWHDLLDGRYCLVDSFDEEGRHYLVTYRSKQEGEHLRGLTDREREVVQAASRGRSNKRIAYDLGLQPSTIGTHLQNAMRKLGLRRRAALIQLTRSLLET